MGIDVGIDRQGRICPNQPLTYAKRAKKPGFLRKTELRLPRVSNAKGFRGKILAIYSLIWTFFAPTSGLLPQKGANSLFDRTYCKSLINSSISLYCCDSVELGPAAGVTGIGEAIARVYASNGIKVVLAARRAERGEKIAEKIRPATCKVCRADFIVSVCYPLRLFLVTANATIAASASAAITIGIVMLESSPVAGDASGLTSGFGWSEAGCFSGAVIPSDDCP